MFLSVFFVQKLKIVHIFFQIVHMETMSMG